MWWSGLGCILTGGGNAKEEKKQQTIDRPHTQRKWKSIARSNRLL